MDEHPQRDILPIAVPTGFDDLCRFVLDTLENWYMHFPEIAEAPDTVGSGESQEV